MTSGMAPLIRNPGDLFRLVLRYRGHASRGREPITRRPYELFAALDVKTGKVIGACHQRHRAQEFRAFLDVIDRNVPPELDVHLVLDNAAIHKTPLIQRWLLKRPRYRPHFTPTSASWLNLVEAWFALLNARKLRRGVFRSTRALEQAIHAYIAAINENPKSFTWTKSADEILASVGRFCQ